MGIELYTGLHVYMNRWAHPECLSNYPTIQVLFIESNQMYVNHMSAWSLDEE